MRLDDLPTNALDSDGPYYNNEEPVSKNQVRKELLQYRLLLYYCVRTNKVPLPGQKPRQVFTQYIRNQTGTFNQDRQGIRCFCLFEIIHKISKLPRIFSFLVSWEKSTSFMASEKIVNIRGFGKQNNSIPFQHKASQAHQLHWWYPILLFLM